MTKLQKPDDQQRKSPSPMPDKVVPVIAKTDFTLQQQMIGFTKCKDLEDWLMGSGESAETADSKAQIEAKKVGNELGEWMFKTFDQNPCGKKEQKIEQKLDPFGDDDNQSEQSDDFMLGGGMHLLNKPKAPDYVGQVAEKCIDLNQFILKMDELVQQHYTTK